MSNKESKDNGIEAQQVSNFLHENPAFLMENPALLRGIELKAGVPEGVISLIEHQVKALREQNSSLSNSLVEIRDSAQVNEKVWQGIYEFLVELMSITKKADTKPYWQEVATLVVRQFKLDDIATFELTDRNRKAVKDFMKSNLTDEELGKTALIIKKTLVEELSMLTFGESRGSMVLFNLSPKKNRVMVLASNDPERYGEGLGTLHLERLVNALRSHAGVNDQ